MEKITMQISRDESGTFFVSAMGLSGVLGTGKTPAVAMHEFVLNLDYYWHELERMSPDEIGPNIKAEQSYLNDIYGMRPAPNKSL